MNWKQTQAFRYSIYGAIFGLFFPIAATLIDVHYTRGLSVSLDSILQVQKDLMLHWIIDTAPVFLGLFAFLAGRRQDSIISLNQELSLAKDAAEAANRAKSAFLRRVSHELRTPMNAILGFTQVMKLDPTFPDKHQEELESILASGEHLLSLINNVIEMSKAETGEAELKISSFALVNLIDGVASSYRTQAEEKGLQFTCVKGQNLPERVNTDEGRLRKVLNSLLHNAVKFTETGEIAVRAKTIHDQSRMPRARKKCCRCWS